MYSSCKFRVHQTTNHPVVLINSPVLTTYGWYELRSMHISLARQLVRDRAFVSAIGHEATALIISSVLGIHCPACRLVFQQKPGQCALVFRLKQRLAEGQVLQTIEEINAIGFHFALLTRHA